ncbi:MAG: glycosyltransferase family 1 protein [Candidatus Omnitrophota bacterium]
MRIGIDIRELEKNKKTGMGRYLINFLNYINQFEHENEYILFANTDSRIPSLRSDIRIKVILEFSTIYWDQIILKNEIKKEKIDIFYSPFYKGPVFSLAKLIVTCHDLHFLNLDSKAIGDFLRRYYCRKILQESDTIITVSEYSKKEIVKFLGDKTKRVEVVYDSVTDEFRPLDKKACFDKVRRSFGLREDFILYVGNLKPHKNLARLINAYDLLPSSLKQKYQLVIVGRKDETYQQLRKLVDQKELTNNVEFLGLVEDEYLIDLYNTASILVLVSLCEGFGLPALEAMACGTPTIVSDITSLPEIVGDIGVLVDPRDTNLIASKLKHLLTDTSSREILSRKGLLRAKNFSVENMARKILKIFKESSG